jgi:uncharacterized protein YceH (UPF0502 family)
VAVVEGAGGVVWVGVGGGAGACVVAIGSAVVVAGALATVAVGLGLACALWRWWTTFLAFCLGATVVVLEVLTGAEAAVLWVELDELEPHPAAASATTAAAAGSRRSLMTARTAAAMQSFPAMHFDQLTAPEQRVLGCLIEKRWTTPDQYPLSLNALRLACNQSTNREPVTDYDEGTVRAAAQRLCQYGLARLASGHGSRAIKYRHLAEEGLGLGREQLAVLAVLLLRGPQTPGELKTRTDRMASLGSLAEVERVLGELIEHSYARRLGRRPGQKEDRFEQLLGGDRGSPPAAAPAATAPPAGAPPAPAPPAAAPADGSLASRVSALEREVEALRAELDALMTRASSD